LAKQEEKMAIGERMPAGSRVEADTYYRCGICGKVLIVEEEMILPNCPVCNNDGWQQVSIDD
jgi:rubrerythrin